MIYQHPLAYLLGLEGIALLRAWAGDYDKAFVEARLAEVRRLLDDEALVNHPGVMVNRGDSLTGYRQWSATYDEPRNDLPDDAVDIVVSGLALAHVPALGPVMAELARVLRPGGHLVISDAHHELVLRGSVVRALGPAGEPGLVATYRHTAGDYLRAALPAGLQVRRCEEPRGPRSAEDQPSPQPAEVELEVGSWQDWPWSLMDLVPEATWAAGGTPPVIIWHFQLAGP